MSRTNQMRLLFAGVVCGIIVGSIWWWNSVSSPISLTFAELKKQDELVLYVEGPGQIRAIQEVFLTVNVEGKLDALYAQPGAFVEAGQTLGLIEEAKNKSDLASALSSFRLANADYQRILRLYNTRSDTRQALDEAKSRLDIETANLELTKKRLEESMLKAPIGGFLSYIAFKEGDHIAKGSRIAVIEDRSQYEVVVSLPHDKTQDLHSITEFDLAPFQLHNGEVGHYTSVAGKISPLNVSSNYDGLNRDIRIVFDRLPEGINLRQSVMVKLPTEIIKDVTILDSSDVVIEKDGTVKLAVLDEFQKMSWRTVAKKATLSQGIAIENIPEGLRAVKPVPIDLVNSLIKKGHRIRL
jgi:RND family efflux transporter MFP subunit